MFRLSQLVPAALALALLPAPALAWGAVGHRAVGRIAEAHLSDEAKRQVAALIGPETLPQVSTWSDSIRSDPAWDHAGSWHYVSIEDGKTYETSPKSPTGDVIEALERLAAVLGDSGAAREKRRDALRWIVHLVGDIHQPLHVGRAGDRGGNSIAVEWQRQKTNMHSVWDSRMIESKKLSFSELAEFVDHATPEEVRAWQAAGVRDWAAESMALRSQVYEIGDKKLGYRYLYVNWPVVEKRLARAGVRLAGFLNEIFAPPAP